MLSLQITVANYLDYENSIDRLRYKNLPKERRNTVHDVYEPDNYDLFITQVGGASKLPAICFQLANAVRLATRRAALRRVGGEAGRQGPGGDARRGALALLLLAARRRSGLCQLSRPIKSLNHRFESNGRINRSNHQIIDLNGARVFDVQTMLRGVVGFFDSERTVTLLVKRPVRRRATAFNPSHSPLNGQQN